MREQYITGCKRSTFIKAVKRYIDQEETKKIRMLMQERDFSGNLKYKDRNTVVLKLIKEYLRHHKP